MEPPPHHLWSKHVQLVNLKSKEVLNNKLGFVVYYSLAADRLHVLLSETLTPHGGGGDPKIVKVKESNLIQVPRPPPPSPLHSITAPPLHNCSTCGSVATSSCGQCRSDYYCTTPACQVTAWKSGGHKAVCKVSVELARTQLLPAARDGNVLAVRAALDAGAGVNAPAIKNWERLTADEFTALHIAGINDHPDVIVELMSRGALTESRSANMDSVGGGSAMTESAGQGSLSAVRALIAAGADVNFKNRNHWTPLHFAAMKAHAAVAALLLENGADVNAVNKDGDSARFVFEQTCNFHPEFMAGGIQGVAKLRKIFFDYGGVSITNGEIRL
jgi:hypothetical protein